MSTRGWESVSAEQLGMYTPRSKYRSVRVERDGLTFDSKAEADYWLKLKDREARGEIHSLRRQVAFALKCPVETAEGLIAQVCQYVADFVYVEAGQRHVVDVKRAATRTAVYRVKRKWLELQTGICIEEVSG